MKWERVIFEFEKIRFNICWRDAIRLRKSITLFSLSTIVDCIRRIICNCVVQTGFQSVRKNRFVLFYFR